MGVPTHPQIELLMATFADLRREGQIIPWVAIEEVLQLSRTKCRFRTVVSRWRHSMLHLKGIMLDARQTRGQGLLVCTSRHMVDYGTHALVHVERTLHKSTAVVQHAQVQELEPFQQRQREHVLKYNAIAVAHMSTMRSTLPTPTLALKPARQQGA